MINFFYLVINCFLNRYLYNTTNGINNLNNSEDLSGSEFEKKGSSELNLQEESSQTSKNSIKTKHG